MRFTTWFNLVATVALGVAVALTPRTANAQLAVADGPTEANTYWLTRQTSTLISEAVKTDSNTFQSMLSLTTGGGSGFYTSAQPDLINWNTTIFSSITDTNFSYLFPGWKERQEGENAASTEQTLVTATLNTYKDVMTVAHDQASELASEDFSGLEARNAGAIHQLDATQITNELLLQVIKELQYERQLTIANIMVNSTQAAQILNEQARERADAIVHGW